MVFWFDNIFEHVCILNIHVLWLYYFYLLREMIDETSYYSILLFVKAWLGSWVLYGILLFFFELWNVVHL